MSAGKSHDAASVNRSGCFRIRSWPPMPDLENPISHICSLPVVARFCLIQGTSSCVMKVSYCRRGSFGLFAYHESIPNVGSMIVTLYWFCALADCSVASPSPKVLPRPVSTGSTMRKLCATPAAGLVGLTTRIVCGPYPLFAEMTLYDVTPELVLPGVTWKPVFCPAQLSPVAAPFAMMPGAPPLKVLSLTAMRCTPFCRSAIRSEEHTSELQS